MSRDALIQLAHVGMHPDRRAQLLERLGSPERLLGAVISGEVKVPARARAAAEVLASSRMEQADQTGVQLLVRGDEAYPDELARLADAPDVLFCRGQLPQSLGVGLVGTRRATQYGLDWARNFGRAIGEAGWPVVSGLARGIDGAAHLGSIEAAAAGVAVLGSGIDVCYPPEHGRLASQLVELGGAVVSEYPPGTPPTGWRFPPRNRIISGLSAVVVVIEARTDGGALITARRGLEQGRDIFAVPGDLGRDTSEGCNLLIRDGAHPVLGTDDLIESVERVLGPSKGGRAGAKASNPLLAVLGPVGRHPDELAGELGWNAAQVLTGLAHLEAEGRITFEGGLAAIR